MKSLSSELTRFQIEAICIHSCFTFKTTRIGKWVYVGQCEAIRLGEWANETPMCTASRVFQNPDTGEIYLPDLHA